MGSTSARSGTYTSGTLTNLYTNSGTKQTNTRLLRIFNPNSAAVTVILGLYNGSSKVETWYIGSVAANTPLTNKNVYPVPAGHSIKFTITDPNVVTEISATLYEE